MKHLQALRDIIDEMEKDYGKVPENNLAASRRLRAKAQEAKNVLNDMRSWALKTTARPWRT